MITIAQINPFTGETIREWEQMDFSELTEAAARARAGVEGWQQVAVADRVEQVRAALDYFETNREVIAADITAQMGRPLAQAHGEVDGLLERFNYIIQF